MDLSRRMLLRIWVPDRPGALGAVTSRLGGVRADVVGLEVVERGGGQAIDELVIDLPNDVPEDLLVRELISEDGVTVEEVREINHVGTHLDGLDAAAALLDSENLVDLAEALCEEVFRYVRASWAVVVGEDEYVLSTRGPAPSPSWITAFTTGSPALLDGTVVEGIDTVWVPLCGAKARLVVGRETAFRSRERDRVTALATIADRWFQRLSHELRVQCLLAHPARG